MVIGCFQHPSEITEFTAMTSDARSYNRQVFARVGRDVDPQPVHGPAQTEEAGGQIPDKAADGDR